MTHELLSHTEPHLVAPEGQSLFLTGKRLQSLLLLAVALVSGLEHGVPQFPHV